MDNREYRGSDIDQFVIVYRHKGRIWSVTMRYTPVGLYVYAEDRDLWRYQALRDYRSILDDRDTIVLR